jgi:hypothetical protein
MESAETIARKRIDSKEAEKMSGAAYSQPSAVSEPSAISEQSAISESPAVSEPDTPWG